MLPLNGNLCHSRAYLITTPLSRRQRRTHKYSASILCTPHILVARGVGLSPRRQVISPLHSKNRTAVVRHNSPFLINLRSGSYSRPFPVDGGSENNTSAIVDTTRNKCDRGAVPPDPSEQDRHLLFTPALPAFAKRMSCAALTDPAPRPYFGVHQWLEMQI